MANKQSEQKLQESICQYIDLQYPNVIYTSDLSGCNVGGFYGRKNKKTRCKNFKIPDLLIFHPNDFHKGLFIEIKNKISDVYNKNGTFKKSNDNHVEKQYKTIVQLRKLGYAADFVFGLENAISVIKSHINNEYPF